VYNELSDAGMVSDAEEHTIKALIRAAFALRINPCNFRQPPTPPFPGTIDGALSYEASASLVKKSVSRAVERSANVLFPDLGASAPGINPSSGAAKPSLGAVDPNLDPALLMIDSALLAFDLANGVTGPDPRMVARDRALARERAQETNIQRGFGNRTGTKNGEIDIYRDCGYEYGRDAGPHSVREVNQSSMVEPVDPSGTTERPSFANKLSPLRRYERQTVTSRPSISQPPRTPYFSAGVDKESATQHSEQHKSPHFATHISEFFESHPSNCVLTFEKRSVAPRLPESPPHSETGRFKPTLRFYEYPDPEKCALEPYSSNGSRLDPNGYSYSDGPSK
jgi:hypothetical protein